MPKSRWRSRGLPGHQASTLLQGGAIEDIDAHIRQVAGRGGRLLDEVGDAIIFVGIDDAKAAGFVKGDADGADSGVSAFIAVVMHQHVIIHLVDVIAGQDQNIVGPALAHKVDILGHGIGGAGVPIGIEAALKGCNKLTPPVNDRSRSQGRPRRI